LKHTLANIHLQRAEAILSVIYPDLAGKEPGWLATGTLEMWIKTLREEPELKNV